MRKNLIPIDISNNPELLRLVEEVEATKIPRKLIRDDKPVAVLMPVKRPEKKKMNGKTLADQNAFRSAIGSWKDIDAEEMIASIYRARIEGSRLPTRP